MSKLRLAAWLALVLAATLPVLPAPCRIDYISHGGFRDDGGCLKFVDDLGNVHEVVNPRGAWRNGMSGTVIAEFAPGGSCSTDLPIRVCRFEADFTRNIVGTLIVLNFIECPGYVIRTAPQDYLVLNCEDYGEALCAPDNLGRRVKAEVFVDTGLSICLGLARSTVLDFEFVGT